MGIIHVITGPDHLAALATLCGTDIKTCQKSNSEAFLHGIRWGIGHTIGLLVAGIVLILVEESGGDWIAVDPTFHMVAEIIVGIYMLGLGAYGIYKADKNNRESVIRPVRGGSRGSGMGSVMSLGCSSDSDSESESMYYNGDTAAALDDILEHGSLTGSKYSGMGLDKSFLAAMENVGQSQSGDDSRDSFVTISMKPDQQNPMKQGARGGVPKKIKAKSKRNHAQKEVQSQSTPPKTSVKRASTLLRDHTTDNSIVDGSTTALLSTTGSIYSRAYGSFKASFCGMRRQFFHSTPSVLALMAGLVHGVAGPGGVLGVIPAVQLRDAKMAALYLGSFCLTSTAVMGGFAAFYGTISVWLAGGGPTNRMFVVEIGSALLSICVGFIWLSLLSMNALDEVFPQVS